MQLKLDFDKTGVDVELPDSLRATVLRSRFGEVLDSPNRAIAAALQHPIGSPPLEELARGKRSAAIAVCDITRPAPNRVVLPHVLAALDKGGMPSSQVSVLVATGLHREATRDELREIVGDDILARYRVESHRARAGDENAYLGETRTGTPVYIDRRLLDADLHITLGFVEPHLMAGFSGGRKLLSIGLAGEKTIKRLHSPVFMHDPQATEGSFPDNPLHRELIEIASMAGHDFIVDVALTRSRGIAAVFAGEPLEAHAAGVAFVRQSTLAAVEEPADAVITTSGGYPLDLTFYQAVKGVTAASQVVKAGGTVLLVAACREGLGSAEFSALVRRSADSKNLLDELRDSPVVIDQWQAEKLALVAEKANLAFCVPGVDPRDRRSFWGPAFDDPQRAVDHVVDALRPDASLIVIPEGPYVFAQAATAS